MSKKFVRVDKCDRCGKEQPVEFDAQSDDARRHLMSGYASANLYARGEGEDVGGDVCGKCAKSFRDWWSIDA